MAKKIEDSLKDEGKVGKGKGGKAKKPSMADVKEANKAVLDFPADANKTPGIEVTQTENTEAFPNDRVGEDTPPAAAGEDTPATIESAEAGAVTTPVIETPVVPDPIDENPLNPGVFGSPIIISETVTPVVETTPTPAPIEETPIVATVETPVVETIEEAPSSVTTDEATEPAKPTQEELEEKVIERWYNQQNKPADINHFELAYSSGINMDRFSNLEAKVGKFKFNRSFVGDKWQITVEEK